MSAERFFDDLARTLAEPMPRRRAMRVIGASVAAFAVPGVSQQARAAIGAPRQGPQPPPPSSCLQAGGPNMCCKKEDWIPGTTRLWKDCGYPYQRYDCVNFTCVDRCRFIARALPPGKRVVATSSAAKQENGAPKKFECCIVPDTIPRDGECLPKTEVCGPDITDALDDALSRVKSEFGSWSGTKRTLACVNLVTLPLAAVSWDIVELGPHGREAFARAHRPDCSTCGFSVRVGRDCHYSGSVNYSVFGVMMRLCHDHFSKEKSTLAEWFSSKEMGKLIYVYKHLTGERAGNYEAADKWARAGYHSGRIPQGDRRDECLPCTKPYSGPGLTVRWLPVAVIRP